MLATLLDIVSIGSAAAQLQTPIAVIRRVADQLDIKPTARINNIDHFSTADLERIGDELARKKKTT